MEVCKLIPDKLAINFPFLYQTIKLNKGNEQDFMDISKMGSPIPAVQNTKAVLMNFYKCISRF